MVPVTQALGCRSVKRVLATFQAALRCHLSTQGIGLRPQPWAPFSRPVGPDGPATRVILFAGGRVPPFNSLAPSPRLETAASLRDSLRRTSGGVWSLMVRQKVYATGTLVRRSTRR